MSFKICPILLSLLWHCADPLHCNLRPLPGPEIFQDFYTCSVTVDWRRYVANDCRKEALGYEVEYINGCTVNSLKRIYHDLETLSFSLPNQIPGECFENNHCYARVRTRLSEPNTAWSDYSAWTTLSRNFEAMKGKELYS